MRTCWLASSRRMALFGQKLQHVWPKPQVDRARDAKSVDDLSRDPSLLQGQPMLPLMEALGRRIITALDDEGLFRISPG